MDPYLMQLHLGTSVPTCWYLDSAVPQSINIDILVPQRSRTSMRLPHHQYQYILISRGHTSIRPYPCVCTFTHQYLNLSVPKHPYLDTAAPQCNSTNAPAHQCSGILYGDTDGEKNGGETQYLWQYVCFFASLLGTALEYHRNKNLYVNMYSEN